MTKKYIPISLAFACALAVSGVRAQDQFSTEFETIRQDLVSWDPVRGEWLASSMKAMSNNEAIPDRNFPEDFTPYEMLKVVPENTRMRMMSTADSQFRTSRDGSTGNRWREVSMMMNRSTCSPVMGRSYGDPHLTSFDGVSNSFQTVGEFIMVKSASDNMEVQVRQKATSDEISVTTAVAMNVAGDRVCIYGKDAPDGNNTTPLRINGEAIYLENDTYYLSNGGTIRGEGSRGAFSRDNFEIRWPSGETVKVAGTSQMDVVINVYPCSDSYMGILGNANNNRSDDFNPRGSASGFGDVASLDFGDAGVSDDMQRQYLAFLSKDFAMSWRITPQESLFDYGFNQSTYTFTDLSYPRVHRTINDMSVNDRDRARRECERAGIASGDMNGCIYDVGFARIPPSPRPVIADNTVNREIRPVTTPIPNVNPGTRPTKPVQEGKTNDPTVRPPAQTIDGTPGTTEGTSPGKQISTETKSPSSDREAVPATKETTPVVTKKPVPAYEPPVEEEKPKRPISTWGSGSSSTPTPVKTPSPVSTPAPTPAPRTSSPAPVSVPAPVKAPAPVSTPAPKPVVVPSPVKTTTPTPVITPKVGRG